VRKCAAGEGIDIVRKLYSGLGLQVPELKNGRLVFLARTWNGKHMELKVILYELHDGIAGTQPPAG
jgi:hypothetical protein